MRCMGDVRGSRDQSQTVGTIPPWRCESRTPPWTNQSTPPVVESGVQEAKWLCGRLGVKYLCREFDHKVTYAVAQEPPPTLLWNGTMSWWSPANKMWECQEVMALELTHTWGMKIGKINSELVIPWNADEISAFCFLGYLAVLLFVLDSLSRCTGHGEAADCEGVMGWCKRWKYG